MTTPDSMRRMAVELPAGFIGLPTHEPTADELESVARGFEAQFNLGNGDRSAAAMAHWLSVTSQVAGAGGMEFTAIGIFHSPNDLERPVSVLITGRRMASSGSPAEAIAGMQELFERQEDAFVQSVQLQQAGQALLVTTEQPMTIPVEGQDEVGLLQRQVTAWIPDSTGSVLGVVSVSSGSWQDWAHVCDLALRVFDSVQWEPTDISPADNDAF
jgi:hypothetical protein